MAGKLKEWDESYERRENFIFYPHEEVIRFVSKYIRKQVGIDQFIDKSESRDVPKVLDFGCGIGRHLLLLDNFGLEAYGFDHSEKAIEIAKHNFKKLGVKRLIDKVIVSDITRLPYSNNYFNYMLSHGVLDSMYFETARNGILELHRCLQEGGKMYFDVISTTDNSYVQGQYEKQVSCQHESGTIQSYFCTDRINELIDGFFKIIEKRVIVNECVITGYRSARNYVVVEKI